MNDFDYILGKEYELSKCVIPHYDEFNLIFSKKLDNFYKDSNVKILEIGTGYGDTSKIILDSIPNSTLITVDNSPQMIFNAKKKLSSYIHSNRVEIIECDALIFLKNEDSSTFDGLVSQWTLHNFNSTYRLDVLKNIRRVLLPGALFLNGDKYAQENSHNHKQALKNQLYDIVNLYINNSSEEMLRAHFSHYLDDEKEDVIMKELESLKIMDNLGFSNVGITSRFGLEAILSAVI
jgi:ubiquinone/menaquinone biosynthesis C-methylase UbiE